jgi:predicted  nucleic acid-binding Zn-ribbon protein
MPHKCTSCGKVFQDGSKEMLAGCPDCGGNKFQYRPASRPGPDDEPGPSDDPGSSGRSGSPATADQRSEPTDGSTAGPGGGNGVQVGSESGASPGSRSAAERAGAAVREFVGLGGDTDAKASPETDAKASPEADAKASPETDADADTDATPDGRSDSGPRKPGDWIPGERPGPADGSDRATAAGRDGTEGGADVNPELPAERDGDRSGSAPSPRRDDEPGSEDRAQADARSSVAGSDEIAAGGPAADDDGPPAVDGRVIEPSSDERPSLEDLREELNDQFESIRIVSPGQYELNLMELYNREEYIISLQEDGRYVIEVPESWRSPPDDG